jgi:hypothetical protein
MIQLENGWTDLDEIWYGRMPLGLPQNRTFQLRTIGNTNMAEEQTCEVGSTLAPLTIGPYDDVWFVDFRKIQDFGIVIL